MAKGSRVAALLDDPLDFVTVLLGTWKAGAVAVPLPLWMNTASIRALVAGGRCEAVVVDELGSPASDAIVDCCATLRLSELINGSPSVSARAAVEPADLASVLYSSGTTSVPKGAVHTHLARWLTQRRFIRRFALGGDTVTLIATPLYTSLTWASLLPTLAASGTCVFAEEFAPETFLGAAEAYGATLAMMVPAQYALLVEAPSFAAARFGRFEHLICAGAKSEDRVRDAMLEVTGGRFIELLGSTETDALSCMPTHAPRAKRGSVGLPLDDVEIAVVDEAMRELPQGATGEIIAFTPSLMLGYDHAPHLNANALWTDPRTGRTGYRMGDLGRIDDNGYVWITGRRKDLIIAGGFKIYPDDIEQVLFTHPEIREAAVVGMPLPKFGEVPFGFVRVTDGSTVAASELCRWANARLSSHQRLFTIEIIEEMPRNASGKILKKTLSEWAASLAGGQREATA